MSNQHEDKIDLDQLEALARAASHGPWTYTGPEYGDGGGQFHNVESPVEEIVGEFGPSKENAEFIAAADPDVVSELITLARKAQEPAVKAGWISVGEQLPQAENGDFIWACWDGAGDWHHEQRQGKARYVPGMGWQPVGCMGWDWNVTHWQPLPALPSKESGNV